MNSEIQETINKCKLGDPQAEYQLYRSYEKQIYNTCYRIVNERETALDMLQEVFVKAFDKLNSYNAQFAFYTWLNRIAVNHCINHLQKSGVKFQLSDNLAQHENTATTEHSMDVELNVRRVKDAIGQLAAGYRTVMNLYLLEGYDHAEIGQILDITESTSKSQFARAKRKVREILKERIYE